MKLELIDKKKETEDTFSFIFKTSQPVGWKAGQFIFYEIPHKNPDERGIERHFTISKAPHEKNIMLTTRFDFENGSTFKNALFNLEIGDIVEAHNIRGNFTIKDFKENFVFIAGGVGITPYRPIILDIINKNESPDVILFYCNRDNELIFGDLLENLEKEHKWFKMHKIIEPVRIDEEIIRNKVPDLESRKFYISGSRKMVEIVYDILLKLGVKEENITKDYFPGYEKT